MTTDTYNLVLARLRQNRNRCRRGRRHPRYAVAERNAGAERAYQVAIQLVRGLKTRKL